MPRSPYPAECSDTVAENHAFAADQEFPFRLLSDPDRQVGSDYGVARPAADRFAAFARRYSYLIDPEGIVRAAYDVTDVATHVDDILADLRALTASA